jgi:hypothetical protein
LRYLDIHQESATEGDEDMAIDLRKTEAGPEPFPAGIYILEIEVKGGSADREDCLRWAKNRRSALLHLEYTVVGGKHNGRKIWDYITVGFDESDKDDASPLELDRLEGFRASVRMGLNRVRAIIDSAHGLQPKDHSPAADAKRLLESYEALDGLRFCAQVDIEPARGKFSARNCVDFVITPELPDYRPPASQPPDRTAVVQLKRTRAEDPDDEIPF